MTAAAPSPRSRLGAIGWSVVALMIGCATQANAASRPLGGATVQTLAEAGGEYQLQVVSYRDLPFRSVVRQQYDFSCGSASLATLLRYQYGVRVGETDVFKAMYAVGDQKAIQKLGFSLLDMKRYLASKGIVADGYKAPLDLLEKTHTPAIVVINVGRYKHFVVIKGLRGNLVLVGDPAVGIRTFRRSNFAKIWDGTMFVVHDHAPQPALFNNRVEWSYVPDAPLAYALYQQQSMSELTRDLPITFQIIPEIQLPLPAAGSK